MHHLTVMPTTTRDVRCRMDRNEERGLLAIGSLPLTTGNSPSRSGSTPNGREMSSAITGVRSLTVPDPANRTGQQLSAIAAASLQPVIAAMAAERPEPHRVDNLLVASLPPSVGSALRQETRSWNDPIYGYDFEISGYSLRRQPPAEDLVTACEMVSWCCRAVEPNVVKMLLAELRVSTKSRAETEDDAALGYQVYADELARYPHDIACAAVRKLARTERFYPSLSELREQLTRESRRRRLLRDALRKGAPAEATPETTPREKPSQEDIAYVDKLLAPMRAEVTERGRTLRDLTPLPREPLPPFRLLDEDDPRVAAIMGSGLMAEEEEVG